MVDRLIYLDKTRIVFRGEFRIGDLTRPLANLHKVVQEAGYSDVILDFSACTAAFADPMLGSYLARAAHFLLVAIGVDAHARRAGLEFATMSRSYADDVARTDSSTEFSLT